MTEKAIRLAASLYQTRDGLKRRVGETEYFRRIRMASILMRLSPDAAGLAAIETAGRLAQVARSDGEPDVSEMYLAAAVELLEPST